MFCSFCGLENKSQANFCLRCGRPLNGDSAHNESMPMKITDDMLVKGYWENFKYCLISQYAMFSGRASLHEFWRFFLVNLSIEVFLKIFILLISQVNYEVYDSLREIVNFWRLFILIPMLAVIARRFHDINLSGWRILFLFVPVFGILYWLYCMVKRGDVYPNSYGWRRHFLLIRKDDISMWKEESRLDLVGIFVISAILFSIFNGGAEQVLYKQPVIPPEVLDSIPIL